MSQSQPTQHDLPHAFDFEIDDSLVPWNLPANEWLTKHNKHWDGLATGSIVFSPHGKVLIIQRASHDSMPNKWEIPGGAADEEDPSLFHGAARELWEETGLIAKRFTHIVSEGLDREPGQVFTNRSGTRTFCRFSFHVEVESCERVQVDPKEHQDFVWVTEDEIRAQKIGDRELPVTSSGMLSLILEAFRLRKEMTKTA